MHIVSDAFCARVVKKAAGVIVINLGCWLSSTTDEAPLTLTSKRAGPGFLRCFECPLPNHCDSGTFWFLLLRSYAKRTIGYACRRMRTEVQSGTIVVYEAVCTQFAGIPKHT
jgi:hypothetical protein